MQVYITIFVSFQFVINQSIGKKYLKVKPPNTCTIPFLLFFSKIQFLYETTIVQRVEYIENQIKTFSTFIIKSDNEILIKHLFSMIDGKIYNTITPTTFIVKCYLCDIFSTNFNNVEVIVEIIL